MASIKKRADGMYRARYRDGAGKEHARHFARKIDAQQWLDGITASVAAGTYTDPKTARTTVAQWCDAWLAGVRPAHVAQIGSASADLVLGASPWALERSIRAARARWTACRRGSGITTCGTTSPRS